VCFCAQAPLDCIRVLGLRSGREGRKRKREGRKRREGEREREMERERGSRRGKATMREEEWGGNPS